MHTSLRTAYSALILRSGVFAASRRMAAGTALVAILRDAAKGPLLRMRDRVGLPMSKTADRCANPVVPDRVGSKGMRLAKGPLIWAALAAAICVPMAAAAVSPL